MDVKAELEDSRCTRDGVRLKISAGDKISGSSSAVSARETNNSESGSRDGLRDGLSVRLGHGSLEMVVAAEGFRLM
jgi:hypothetical protein